ncbi:MAG: ATP-binding protein [Paludibacteraceae bacterium]|nr:ATP-binding protein [Paludibacteraceae bacterium]
MIKEKVSIATKPLVYQVFRHIANKVHNALAEYVDNSISSFNKHIDVLKPLNPNGRVRVDITITDDYIQIKDNAFGIEEENYQRAFELARVPLDATGLNEFGMGMKVSSIWLSNHWVVESKAFGENLKKTFVFDLEEVLETEKTDVDVEEIPADVDEHYTVITLTNLSQFKPTNRQISGIKKHLCSIYSQFIRDGIVDIYVNDELLVYQEPKILYAPHYKNGGESIKWRMDINYSFGNGQSVKGFVAILEQMSNNENNGFLLFRRGRTIGTSSDDKYRPKCLCGDVGSPQYKRIFGELEIEGFDVSFTKNAFNEDDQFQAFIEALRDEIKSDKTIDIFGQAQNYRKAEDPKKVEKKAVSTMAQELSKSVIINTAPSTPTEAIPQPSQTDSAMSFPLEETLITPIFKKMKIDGVEYNIEIRFEKIPGSTSFYSISSSLDNRYVIRLHMDNPYFKRYNDLLKDEESAGPVLHLVQAVFGAELLTNVSGYASEAKVFRDKLNSLIGRF